METFSEDTQFILQQAGLEEKLSVEWKHRTGASHSYLCLTQSCFTRDDQNIFYIELKIFSPGTGGSSDTIVDYYSQLTQSEVAALFRKYQLDFELYDYNPEPYFEIAQVTAE